MFLDFQPLSPAPAKLWRKEGLKLKEKSPARHAMKCWFTWQGYMGACLGNAF
jgi:hypothetical protein